MTRHSAACVMAMFAMAGTAAASDLAPGDGHSIYLGRLSGVVYYTVEQDGYRVVATLAEGDEGLPVRFVATLGEGQALAISIPGRLGERTRTVEFARTDGKLLVNPQSEMDSFAIAGP